MSDIDDGSDQTPEVVPNVIREDGKKITVTQRTMHASFESPYPPPDFLRKYQEFDPEAASKIFAMILKQQDFEIEIRRRDMDLNDRNFDRVERIDAANIKEQADVAALRRDEIEIKKRGQWFAVGFGVLLILAAIYFARIDHAALAGASLLLVATMAAILFLQVYKPDGGGSSSSAEKSNQDDSAS
ncbi:MAG: DUF2335 domain-containing protein [Pseudomonadota bacterium]|nr:DUF2335 domain-containing protein [Pseudomonadota bacterium]